MSHADRLARTRARMAELGVGALGVAFGPDLLYLSGYEAIPTDRITMLVVRTDGAPQLFLPELELARVSDISDEITVRPWHETDDPIELIAEHLRGVDVLAIGDQLWARFVLALQAALPTARFVAASTVTGPLRAVKDDTEIAALTDAAAGVDQVASALRRTRFRGRTERDLHRELVDRILDVGHERVNFAIVATGPNGASPHHEPGDRIIEAGDVVLCDFGGTMRGYCSDITRMYSVGEPNREVRDAYAALVDAQEAAFQAARVGTPCVDVDATARAVLGAAGLAERFVHRTGHGIGLESHEDPFLVATNTAPLSAGQTFSIEPGVYLTGAFGLRLEDIVVATGDGPRRLNQAARDVAVVD